MNKLQELIEFYKESNPSHIINDTLEGIEEGVDAVIGMIDAEIDNVEEEMKGPVVESYANGYMDALIHLKTALKESV